MAEVTYIQAVRDALVEELRRDARVYLLGQDVGAYGGAFKLTDGLVDEFGAERIVDTPISESAIVGAAIGSAYMGMRPVAEIQFMDFITCCFQMVTNFAAKSHWRWGASVPIVIRGPVGAGVGAGPFHSQAIEAYFYHTPGLKIVAPATVADAKGLLKAAIRDDNPVLFLEHKRLYRQLKAELDPAAAVEPLGRARVIRPGRDMTIITYSATVHSALEVANRLDAAGEASIEVVDLRTIKPVDWDTVIASVRKTNKALVLHEDQLTGGIGGDIAAEIGKRAFEWLDGPVYRLGAEDVPVPFNHDLEYAFLPNDDKLMAMSRELLAY